MNSSFGKVHDKSNFLISIPGRLFQTDSYAPELATFSRFIRDDDVLFEDRGDRKASTPDTSKLSLLYSLTINLPQAWQIGFNPTISYNNKSASGNKWNVPVGLFAGKTVEVGKMPVNIKAGLEYSVVSEDTFGKRAVFRFQITPVVPSLIQNPMFGGGS